MQAIAERHARQTPTDSIVPIAIGTDLSFCIISQSAAADTGLLSLSPFLLRPAVVGIEEGSLKATADKPGTSPQYTILNSLS